MTDTKITESIQTAASMQAVSTQTASGKQVIHPLTIGGVTLENNLVLGPMAGVTDLPFRLLCKQQGVGLVCMEMVSAKAIFYNNKNTYQLLEVDDRERPVSLQLFGSDPECISEMAKRIEDRNWDILDINMGCPVPKVFNNGDGSALMKNPALIHEIVEKTVKAISKPVTVKIRTGVDDAHINAVEVAKIIEDAGAAAIAVHGRTREQFYSGKANWDIIAQVKDAVSIPVIGNGDITSPEDVERMQCETGVDGYMIARGAQGNPWIFSNILEYYKTGVNPGKPPLSEMIDTMLTHARLMVEVKGEVIGIREMRKHAAWYTAGYRNSSRLRGMINEVNTYEELENLFYRILEEQV